MTCSFTGHRPKKLVGFGSEAYIGTLCELLKKEIVLNIHGGVDTFMSGMALGIDMLAAKCVLELKERTEFKEIKLVAVIPCNGQERLWNERDKLEYQKILSECDEKTVLSDKYTSSCMHIRNRYLVDHADCMIAVWDGSPGGTGNTVALAAKKGVPVTVIDPRTLTSERPITLF